MSNSKRNDAQGITYQDIEPRLTEFRKYLTALHHSLANERGFQNANQEFRIPNVAKLITALSDTYFKRIDALLAESRDHRRVPDLSIYGNKFEAIKEDFVGTVKKIIAEENKNVKFLTRQPVEKGFIAYLQAKLMRMPEYRFEGTAKMEASSSLRHQQESPPVSPTAPAKSGKR